MNDIIKKSRICVIVTKISLQKTNRIKKIKCHGFLNYSYFFTKLSTFIISDL